MTTEELLTPRWEVIADFPNNYGTFRIGEIITGQKHWSGDGTFYIACHPYDPFPPEHYPAIFKKLAWWEKRNEEELPKYVNIEIGDFKRIVKVDNYMIYKNNILGIRYYKNFDVCSAGIRVYLPSTKEEYDKQTTGTTTN